MLNQIKRVGEIKKFRDHNIRMILNVNIKETLNTYATTNIKIQHYKSEKKDKGWSGPCVTQWTIGGHISLHGLKVKASEEDLFNVRLLQNFRGVRILCYYYADWYKGTYFELLLPER